jgi:hypothetical protein
VASLTDWRDRFLASREVGLHSGEVDVEDEEKRRLSGRRQRQHRQRTPARENRAAGEQSPFGIEEVER